MSNTVIGSTIVIEGEIVAEEALFVQGTIKGRVQTRDNLYVDESAVIEADVESENVEVAGSVTGNVTASERVELKGTGRMIGDLRCPRVLIADGAVFKGHIDMEA